MTLTFAFVFAPSRTYDFGLEFDKRLELVLFVEFHKILLDLIGTGVKGRPFRIRVKAEGVCVCCNVASTTWR